MRQRAERTAASTTLLTIRTDNCSWGLPGAAVTGVEPFDAEKHRRPLDVLELLAGATTPRSDDTARVLELLVGGERLSLLSCGTLTLLDASSYQLLAMPPELGVVAPLVSHIAVIGGRPALFVLSPERLQKLDRELRSALTPPLPDRGSSC